MPKSKQSNYVTKQEMKSYYNKNIETKFKLTDFNGTPTSVFNSAVPYHTWLNTVGSGSGQHNRIGHQVKHTGMYGRLFLEAPLGGGAPAQALCRLIMYIPKNSDDDLNIPYNGAVDTDKFTILMEKLFVVGSDASVPRTITMQIKRKLRNVTQYSGGNAVDVSKNPIGLFIVSDTVDDVEINGFIKCFYKDA